MTPKISIITPTHNRERYLPQCLESVRAQTFGDWEQIVIDDGSTDSTPDIMARWKDERVQYVRQECRGVLRLPETNNHALGRARAPLIAFLEDDDYWHPEMLATQFEAMRDPEVVLAFAEIAVIVGDSVQPALPSGGKWKQSWRTNNPPGSALTPLLSFYGGMPHPATWLIRRQALDSIGGVPQPQTPAPVDLTMMLNLSLKGRFAYTNRVLAYWRKHPNQATNVLSAAIWSGGADYAESFYEALPQALKANLGIRAGALRRRLGQVRAFGHFRQGRCSLLERRWPEARGQFARAFSGGSAYVKAASAAGICASWLGTDLEPVARCLGKEWYRRS